MDLDRRELLAQVAVWYYEDGVDQEKIAARIGKSRSMVSRMLNEVRELGLVEIRVKYPMKRHSDLERRLTERYGLKSAWILASPPRGSESLRCRVVGRLASTCLLQHVHDGIRIGMAWSSTIKHLVVELPDTTLNDAMVVQISGSVSLNNPSFDGPELVRTVGQKLNAECRFFPAPLVVRDAELRDSLMQESTIREAMRLAETIDVAILGLGNVRVNESTLRSSGLLDESSYQELERSGVAGDIIARQFDRNGRLLPVAFNDRVVGLDPESLRRVPTVIAVACGVEKVRPILAAMRGGWINVLVSDADTVEEALALAEREEQGRVGT